VTAADAVVQALAESDPELPGFTGPEAVVGALVAASGRVVVEETRLRLFILGELIPPTGVRGSPRLLAEDDLGLVGSWIEEFVRQTRMGFGGRTGAEVAAQWLQIGAGAVVWVVDGEPVSLARFGPPAAGVSRVGSVFTPEDRRGHGYGAAATAAVSRLAWDAEPTMSYCSPIWPTRCPTGSTAGSATHRSLTTDRCGWRRRSRVERRRGRTVACGLAARCNPVMAHDGTLPAPAGLRSHLVTTLLVLQPSATDPLGPLADWLTGAGATLRVVRPYLDEPVPADLVGVAGVVCLGGEMSAADYAAHPWLPAVRALLGRAVAERVPVLAICLGAQLLALATGGVVATMTQGAEAGVRLVAKRDAAAADPLLGALPFTPDVVQFHSDEVTRLPAGATLLAVSAHSTNQAFRVGASAWGLQFHIETTPGLLRQWMRDEPDVAALMPPTQHDDDVLDRAHRDLAETWQPIAERFVQLTEHPPFGGRQLPLTQQHSRPSPAAQP